MDPLRHGKRLRFDPGQVGSLAAQFDVPTHALEARAMIKASALYAAPVVVAVVSLRAVLATLVSAGGLLRDQLLEHVGIDLEPRNAGGRGLVAYLPPPAGTSGSAC